MPVCLSRFALLRTITIAILMFSLTNVAWSGPYSILHVFLQTPHPSSGLMLDVDGNAYGTTGFGGGLNNAGTAYQISPSSGYRVVHAFSGSDGRNPGGTLVSDAAGNIYGVTAFGGTFTQCGNNMGCGTVFELSPPKNGGDWTETVLYNFSGGNDGAQPSDGVIFDTLGNLYGVTAEGGGSGCGVVYELIPTGNGQWTEQVLHSFASECSPAGGLVFDDAGNLYGTTFFGGTFNGGAAFQLSPSPGNNWTYAPIYEFNPNENDAEKPVGTMVFDSSGNLYGATYAGGSFGLGTVFELTPNSGAWAENILHNFAGGNDGSTPSGNLIFDGEGNVYGVTSYGGGGKSLGTIFKLEPSQGGNWTETVFGMGNGPRGAQPNGPLLLDGKGNVYGTTGDGGRTKNGVYGHGVVFRLNIGQ